MNKSELKQLIREEIQKIITEEEDSNEANIAIEISKELWGQK